MPLFGGGSSNRGWFARPRALTAAATRTGERENRTLQLLHQPWQAQVFRYYDEMGECYNPAQFVARALAKCRLYAATGDPDDPEELESGWAFDLVQAWQEIPEPYGRLRALIGEGRLTQSRAPEKEEPLSASRPPVWEFLSPTELKLSEEGRKVQRETGGEPIVYTNISDVDGAGDPEPGEMRMWRLWRPHPRNSAMADSAFRSVRRIYEQLWWLTLSERADLRNRAANQGLLLIPKEIVFDEDEQDAEEEDRAEGDSNLDPMQEQLQEMLTAAISDPDSADAASPGVVRAKAEYLHPDVFRHIRFHDPSSSLYVSDRERALIYRISVGLEMPVEAVTGSGTLNHWNAWKLDDERFQHVQPEGEALAKDLTEVVLRPIGRASEQSDAENVFVAIDWAELVSDPDKGKTAIELRKIGVIGDPATREANDFDESAAMTDEERQEFLAIALRDPALVDGAADTTDPAQNEEPPAEPATAPAADSAAAEQAAIDDRIIVAAAREARTATGRWVLGKRRSCPACFSEAGTTAPEAIVAALGPERVTAIGEHTASLSARTRDRFYAMCESLGYEPPLYQASTVEVWFAETLYEREPDETGLLTRLGR